MKKFLTLTALFALCLAVSVQATETRGLTMGNANNIIKDDGNIWLYPSAINLYPDQAEAVFSDGSSFSYAPPSGGGFSSGDAHRFGAHFQFNENNPFVLGVYVVNEGRTDMNNKYAPGVSTFFESESGQEFSVWSNRSVNLFYGRTLGQNPFGAHLSLLHNSAKSDNPSNDFDESFTKIMLDLGLTTNGGAVDWTLGFYIATWTDEQFDFGSSSRVIESEPDGNYGAHLRVRKFHPRNAKLTWVWHGEVAIDKQGVTYPDSSGFGGGVSGSGNVISSECTHFLGDIGLGLNYTLSSSALAVLDFGLRYNALKVTDTEAGGDYERKLTDFTIPYWRVGMDGEVLSWLDVRFGATNRHSFLKEENSGSALTSTITDNAAGTSPRMVVGTGLHFGALTIDTWMDPSWVLEGPTFIGGDEDRPDMFFEVSGVYHFGK